MWDKLWSENNIKNLEKMKIIHDTYGKETPK